MVRAACVDLVLGQDVRLPSEAANPLDATNKACNVLRLDSLEFLLCGTFCQKFGQLLVDGLFIPAKSSPGLAVASR